MSNLEKQVAALVRLVTAEDEDSRKAAKAEVLSLMEGGSSRRAAKKDLASEIHNALLEIGIPTHIKGYQFVVEAITFTVHDMYAVNAITKELYPHVAKVFQSTPSRVERAIRHAVEVAWDRGDLDVFQRYFGNSISPNKGKPTNSEFISRMANEMRMRMKEVA
jgi:two-component system response regulator (stage 0 sporulation protein A)